MIVLSLFDGMACGYEALKRAGIPVTKYYASEIDKYAIQIAKKNHPDIIHLGDVEAWYTWDIEKPDLIIGGSPCQGFSVSGNGLNFKDPRSKLFFDMVDIIEFYEPEHYLLENVRMKADWLNLISEYMRVEPHFINSDLVSAQSRQRFYWYNWFAPDPEDKNIFLQDIVEDDGKVDRLKSYCINARFANKNIDDYFKKKYGQVVFMFQKPRGTNPGGYKAYNGKVPTLTASRWEQNNFITTNGGVWWRKLTPIECERLQTLPDNYTEGVSNTQRYKMLGNGWTVDVLAHLFTFL